GLSVAFGFDEGDGSFATSYGPAAVQGEGLFGSWFWVPSGARLAGPAPTLSGHVLAGGNGVPNIPVTALLPALSVQPALPIPDLGSLTSTNFVGLSGTIGWIKVNVNIGHPFAGDLELTLIHPDGTEVRLKNADATDDSQNVVTTYTDATHPVNAVAILFTGRVPGAWRWRVRDAFALDTGILRSWTLQFGGPPALTDATGSYTLTGLLGLTNLAAPIYTVLPLRNGFVFSPPSILTPANTANVDFTLVSGFISGRVTDQNNGRPGVIVSAGPGLNATTDANGNYYLSPLPPGNYTLTASLPGYAFSPAQLPNVPI